MNIKNNSEAILVVEENCGIYHGIEKLLTTDGYRVMAAHEQAIAQTADYQPPDLILICSGEPPLDIVSAANRIREHVKVSEQVPVVIFCMKAVAEGTEVAFDHNVYAISPDNFNHLRSFLKRLLNKNPN